ncbi:SDR family NAD(P)-dependent oxidoreductase [Geomicrobium sp. JCM 19055]|uniref:SDR family NAD(P)-dependent oxidoreductase n=1 Tax=Geomicrobium sp. JCM 19055 TaxID=1460649 RepID=UPI00045ECF0F|nr:SDR family NAD(P)-dependent oxidoreductase [Geomicrobium sp. JCM 19055]GAJ99971.1 2-hydroxycyclohexanecarboxyl-CoA dehydrogenase [Geomicrobium sp. JCM 19055]
MKVVVTDIDQSAAEETVSLLETEAIAVRCDVTSLKDVSEATNEAMKAFGQIDVLINNAGWDKIEPFLESEPHTWEKVIAINLLGQIHTCKTVLPQMIEQGHGGKVINLASDSARVGSSGEAVYSAAKGGVVSFTKTLAREMARHKINVNCIAPGPSNTPLLQEISTYNEGIVKALEKAIPFRRLAEAEDIANAVAFLASKEADYITGQTLSVNGGLTMA